jgi:hypothetical protein
VAVYIVKDLQRAHTSFTDIGKVVTFGATPYEAVSFPVNATPSLSHGLLWEGNSGGGVFFHGGTGLLRNDIKLTGAKGSGSGWTFTHEAKGRGYNYSQIIGNRAIATYVYEASDNGDSSWVCRSGGLVANSIIIPDGVSSRRGQNGLDVLTIQSATPDYFLQELELPQMSYILGEPANKERYNWWFLCTYGFEPPPKAPPTPLPTSPDFIRASAQNVLGQTFKGDATSTGTGIANQKYQDPLGGFGYYTDQYTLTVGSAMEPRPCNENHLMAKLSSSRILAELFANHVKANGRPIGEMFNMEVLTSADIEYNILTADVSGTVNSIINEMAQHGVWRTWWDSWGNFHFIPDYYSAGAGNAHLIIQEGPSLIGELEVNLGTDQKRINRAEVRGQPFISFGDATADPLTSNINMALGAVYPPGTPKGGINGGSDVTMDNYMGRNSGEQARRMYNKANAKTTFRWSNFPYPTLAFAMLNRTVAINASDPKGNWSFSDKRFVVTEVDIQLTDGNRPDGGYYLCSMSGIEI